MALESLAQTLEYPSALSLPATTGRRPGRVRGWQAALPTLRGSCVTVRGLRRADAAALLRSLTSEQVTRFISPPPTTVVGFERFIDWSAERRAAGEYFCFALVPAGAREAVGIIQVRRMDGSFDTGEWGFAIDHAYWGTGLFQEAAELVLTFCFRVVGARRIEARAATVNGRGNGALRKLGATCDAVLKRSFVRDGCYLDQYLWSVVREQWLFAKAVWGGTPARPAR